MAHELEMTSAGAAMFFKGETPWHGLGTKLEGEIKSADAIKAAGLDWKVGLKDLYTVAGEDRMPETLVTHKATFRETDGKILGVVGPTWKPLQNVEVFNFFDTFVEAKQAAYETAGSLRGGTRIWVLAALGGDPISIVPKADDTIRKFLLLSNSHDGTLAVRVALTPIRVVCANTLAMAHNDDATSMIKIRHHGNVQDALGKVSEIINTVNAKFEATAEQYRALAATSCTEDTLKKYVNLVFATKKRTIELAQVYGDLTNTNEVSAEDLRSRIYPKIAELFETGQGNAVDGVRGTLWAGYNAITEYLTHTRGKDAGVRLDSAWFGQGHAQNAKALKVGTELVKLAA